MVKIFALVIVLVSFLVVGGGAFAQDRDRTRDQDKTVLHDPNVIRNQDKLQTRDRYKTADPDKDMIRDRKRDRLHQPGDSGMKQGSRTGAGAGGGRR